MASGWAPSLRSTGQHDGLGLLEQREQQVLGLRLGVVAPRGQRSGGLERLL